MKKHIIFLSLIILVASLAGCDKTTDAPSTDLTLTFSTLYGEERMTKYKDYPFGATDFPVQFSRVTTYLSDIELVKPDGSTHRLSEIEYLDFTPDNAPTDLSAWISIPFQNVPEGEYTGLRMGYGVKPSLNAKSPTNFDDRHPLGKENEYWSGWKSYIFNKIEGKVDSDKNGSYDVALLYHCGSDAVYKVYTFDLPIHIHAGSPEISIEFDLKKVFTMDDGSFYDIVNNFYTSNDPADVTVAQVLMQNFKKATTVKQGN